MATNLPSTRPWLRLPSIARPVAPTNRAPEPSAPQPRPPLALPTFRPLAQPQPQEPTAPGAPPTTGVSSVPPSPIRRTSVPSSPVIKATQTTTSSVPSSPIKTEDSASLPTSQSQKPASSPTPQYSPLSPPKSSSPSSLPTSPVKQLPTSPVKQPPTSPVKQLPISPVKTVSTSPDKTVPTITNTFTNGTTNTTRLPTQTLSPRTIKPSDQTPPSPKNKSTAPPLSPLILSPPQLKSKPELDRKIPAEAEQKGVLVQNTIETSKPGVNGTGSQKNLHESHTSHVSHHLHGKPEEHKDLEAKQKGGHNMKFSSDSAGSMKAITLAGDNKGAFLELIKSPVKHGFDGKPHSLGRIDPKTEKGGSLWHKNSSSSSGEEDNSSKDRSRKEKGMHSPPSDAYTNSNVQGVNNSILFNSSWHLHDPGVYLSLSRKSFAKGFHAKDKDSSNGHHS